MKTLFAIILACAVAATSCGCNKGKPSGGAQTKKIGGCTVETISIGTGKDVSKEPPADAAWIRVSSVEAAENELFKKAALDLTKALELRNIEVYRRSELVHIAEGPCWPPYAVELRIKLNEQTGGPFYKYLLNTPIAGHRPTTDRPDNYGPFFITCGFGSSDWWTVWYRK